MALQSFIFLDRFRETFRELDDNQAGTLIKAMLLYQEDGTEPEFTDKLVKFAWTTNIKLGLDAMNERYEKKCAKSRENGSKGGRPRAKNNPDGLSVNPEKPNGYFGLNTKTQQKTLGFDENPTKPNPNPNPNPKPNTNTKTNPKPNIPDTTKVVYTTPTYPRVVDNPSQENENQKVFPESLDGLESFNKKIEPENQRNDYELNPSEAFKVFWQEYPRQQGEQEAKAAWAEATIGKSILPGDLIRAAVKYAAKDAKQTESKYIPMPANFIRKGEWKQYAPRALPKCPLCHGSGYREVNDGGTVTMAECSCTRRFKRD